MIGVANQVIHQPHLVLLYMGVLGQVLIPPSDLIL